MDEEGFKNNLIRNNTNLPPPVFKRKSGIFKWMVIVIVGVILIFIGGIWVILANWTPPPSASSYQNYQDYQKDLNAWKNSTKTGNLYGRIIMGVGTFTLMLAGFLGAIDSLMDEREKIIMIVIGLIAMCLFIIISVGLFVMSPYSIS